MILYKIASDLTNDLSTKYEHGTNIGFVPTMGALHNGHLALVAGSKARHHITVVSIFINPTQFNDPGDLARYPVTLEKDIEALEKAGCDILFLPSVAGIYPGGILELPQFPLGRLETVFDGPMRPGHFQGVCQVMDRLLAIVKPGILFLGQKDYQQCLVIKKLISWRGLPIAVDIIPTIREVSGLAMSSRNQRLTPEGKEKASALYRALLYLENQLKPGDLSIYTANACNMLESAGFSKIDYVAIANADTLEPVTNWDGKTKLIALAAAFLDGVRLIDNLLLA